MSDSQMTVEVNGEQPPLWKIVATFTELLEDKNRELKSVVAERDRYKLRFADCMNMLEEWQERTGCSSPSKAQQKIADSHSLLRELLYDRQFRVYVHDSYKERVGRLIGEPYQQTGAPQRVCDYCEQPIRYEVEHVTIADEGGSSITHLHVKCWRSLGVPPTTAAYTDAKRVQ